MGGGGGQEKTEKATPKRRRDSREKEGNVLQSKDATTAISLALIFFTFFLVGRYMLQRLIVTTSDGILLTRTEVFGETEVLELMRFIMVSFALIAAPILLVGFAIPALASIVQTRGLFTMKPLKPKFSKLNPISGVKKLFSLQTFVEVIKGTIVIAVIMALVFDRAIGRMNELYDLTRMELRQGILYLATETFSLVMLIIVLFIFVAAGDYLFSWYQYEKKLKMSKQEVKDEYKQIEGDPLIKSKIKQKQREVAQMRMMEQVPQADVIVRNPTHYAIAISYDRENNLMAPKVTAKGKDAVALRIITIAEEHEIYIAENRPLAKELYDTVEVGHEIPPSLYNAIAIILTDMYTAKGITLDNVES
ncbi:MAG: flagellar biosynthesis protein FlhB [Oscillospiraceae bacterium]|nr:flagellar biosynthesis protein FlhB [Oscillospiraceae bacterium]